MNINTFEKQFNKTILKRGYDYYVNDYVEDLVQIDAYNWQAEVHGTDLYVVDIRINQNGDIIYADCDCPYEDDCKHIAAVLYKIHEQQQAVLVQPTSATQIQKSTLQQLLQSQTKDQLIPLITKVGQNHPAFITELKMLLTAPDDALMAAEELILYYIDAAQDRRGFIHWNQASEALRGIDTVHEQIEEHIENSNYLMAIQLSLLCFHHAFDALQNSDGSGEFGYAIEESIAFIDQTILEGIDIWHEEQYATVYELILKEAKDEELKTWTEWFVPLLHSCIPLCQDDEIEKQYVAFLHSLTKTGDNWSANNLNRQLKELQLQLITFKYSKADVEQFLEQNIDDANMRERIITSAIKQKDYEKVLQLATDGQNQDQASRGIVFKWKRYAFMALKELGRKEEMRKLALELLMNGDYYYYEEYKMLHSSEEWPVALEQLLDALKSCHSHLYINIITEEQQTKRILDYCKEMPIAIEQYYPYIRDQYYEEVCAIFIHTITLSASRASDRKRYQEVCRTITTMRKAGYELEAKQLISDLQQTYPKRRAFVDELRKLN